MRSDARFKVSTASMHGSASSTTPHTPSRPARTPTFPLDHSRSRSGNNSSLAGIKYKLWTDLDGSLGAWRNGADGLGGWSVDVHHAYDPAGHVLYLGDGNRRSVQSIGRAITRVSDHPYVYGVVAAPHGSFYISSFLGFGDGQRIFRVAPYGNKTLIAGNDSDEFPTDGALATSTSIGPPTAIALGPDGSIYVACFHPENLVFSSRPGRVYLITPDGVIHHVAGGGNLVAGFGDQGPATSGFFYAPSAIAVGPDGTLYIAHPDLLRVRSVLPDGTIHTFAGNGTIEAEMDGEQASQSSIGQPKGLAVGNNGEIYISSFDKTGGQYPIGSVNSRILRVAADGVVTTFAGGANFGFSGDGGPAIQARLAFPLGLTVGPEAACTLPTPQIVGPTHCTRRTIATIAGNGQGGDIQAGVAMAASAMSPQSLAIAADGSLLIAGGTAYGDQKVGRLANPMPGTGTTDILVPSEDGSELYIFTSKGRHLRTMNTTTGSLIYSFTYSATGELVAITDANGNVTTIQRDSNGTPTAIVGPYGHTTTLHLDTNGYLDTVTDPLGHYVSMTYNADGLMRTMNNARGQTAHMDYDAQGRLISDQDQANGVQTLSRTETSTSSEATVTTALGPQTNTPMRISPPETNAARSPTQTARRTWCSVAANRVPARAPTPTA